MVALLMLSNDDEPELMLISLSDLMAIRLLLLEVV
jgi:hypothetical protein